MQLAYAEVIFSFNSRLTPGDLPQFLRFTINPPLIIPSPLKTTTIDQPRWLVYACWALVRILCFAQAFQHFFLLLVLNYGQNHFGDINIILFHEFTWKVVGKKMYLTRYRWVTGRFSLWCFVEDIGSLLHKGRKFVSFPWETGKIWCSPSTRINLHCNDYEWKWIFLKSFNLGIILKKIQ